VAFVTLSVFKTPTPDNERAFILSNTVDIKKMFDRVLADLAKKSAEDIQAVVIYSSSENLISIAHTEDESRCRNLLDLAAKALAQSDKRPPDVPLQ
jgi:hypothetical protein